MMNTSTVAKELGISQSTVQRWVSGGNILVERNQHGHYVFSEANLEALRQMKKELNNNSASQEQREKKVRKGALPAQRSEEIQAVVTEIERKLDEKADSVVSYQLLQHRSDMEELQDLIKKLEKRIEKLENGEIENRKSNSVTAFNEKPSKNKKGRIFQSMFGFRKKEQKNPSF